MQRLLALLVVWLVASPASAQFLSPGPIAKEHGEIAGDDDCSRCHVQGEGVPDRLCNDCHRQIEQRMAKGAGYHGRSAKGQPCAKCHEEHLGREGRLVRWPGGSPEAFNHAATGWPLTGGHGKVKCRDCHEASRRVEANLPANTWLGLPTECAKCHQDDDPHKGQFGKKACDTCHVTEKWKDVAKFDHAKTDFPLRDEHTKPKCGDCHKDGRFADTPTACAKCHETPHPAATQFGDKCERCHTEKGWASLVYAKAEHKKFPLDGGHAKPACKDCHGEKAAKAPPTACNDCHKDIHAGRFGKKCDGCHQIADWRRLKKGAEIDHDKTAFPLRGEHEAVECGDCHLRGKLKPLPHEKCLDCHKDPHKGEVGTRCEDCHSVQGFEPALYPVAKHTAFALTGAHRAVACNECHRPPAPVGPARGGSRERPLTFRKGVTACADCHKDPHEGQFQPRTCDQCHTTNGWIGAGFKHDIWALAGKHATTACASCHDGGRFAGTPRECRECHGDPHLGQFAAGERARDCTHCHTAETWKGQFDHAKVWPLEGAHAPAKCTACHKEVRVGDGRVATRWRLGFKDCARCHENVHRKADAPDDATFARCQDCHTPRAWHEMLTAGVGGFNHDPTGFPLRGQHAAEPCTACHKGKPLDAPRCAGCHVDPHQSRNGDRCDSCHTTRDWRLPDALATHNRTRFPLQGAHLTAACRDCHRAAANDVWSGVDTRCATCHRQDARGVHPSHSQPPFTTRCEQCHNPYAWSPALIDHGRWWPLTGAHATADCSRCHVGDRFAGTSRRCAACHQDDFRRGHTAGESQECADCHRTTAWTPALSVDHDRFFPLPHRGIEDCADCHPSGTRSFSCMTCHTHSRARMNEEHDEVRGYAFEAQACYRCHPRGREE